MQTSLNEPIHCRKYAICHQDRISFGIGVQSLWSFDTCLSILVDGFRVQSRGDRGWPPLACGILSSSSDIEGYRWSYMDETIRLRSSLVGVSRCLRLTRYSFEKCIRCLLEWFGWTVGHISQFWWQGIKDHGASYSETSISYRLNCWWGLMTNSRYKAIPSSTYVPVTIYPTIPWQVKIWSVPFHYAPHLHDDVSLSSPLKRIERKILQLLPVSEVLYSTDLTYILSLQLLRPSIMSSWVMFSSY